MMSIGRGSNRARPAPTAWSTLLGVCLGLAVLIGLLVTAFAWPATESAPRDVPVAVVGPPEATTQLGQHSGGAFETRGAPDADAARQLIADREVYGAIVLAPGEPVQVFTASAASPAVARVLDGAGAQVASATGAPGAEVTDVAPLPEDDPRGSGFIAATLPMVMGGLVAGVAMSLAVSGAARRVGGAVVAAAAAGLTGAAVVQGWLGAMQGSYWANSAAIALTIAAIALTLVGLHAVLGHAGIGLGAIAVFLLGNPLSAASSAPEMLPSGWGTFGQLLPPGAGTDLLRSTAYFDGAAAGAPLLVLGSWAAGGLLLAALAGGIDAGRARAVPRQAEALSGTTA